jgi:hypothetical protein
MAPSFPSERKRLGAEDRSPDLRFGIHRGQVFVRGVILAQPTFPKEPTAQRNRRVAFSGYGFPGAEKL